MRISLYLLMFFLHFFQSGIIFSADKPYVVLISFDAFRWDYPARGLSPHLDNFKHTGVSALSLRPGFPSKTFPNHISIITGMHPENHGILANDFTDPFTHREYRIGDSLEANDARWYLGEAFWETAERQGITTASYFWPGSELTSAYRRPSYYKKYEHKKAYRQRVDGVIDWLKLPGEKRPHFITMYFDATDTQGHRYGPQSQQTNAAIMQLDSVLGYFMERLKEISLYDSTNIIVVSDHGMTETSNSRVINIEKIIGSRNIFDGYGPVMQIKPLENSIENIYNSLKQKEAHFKVYTVDNIPGSFHFSSNPFILPIIIVADPGWTLVNNRSEKTAMKYSIGGNHGYDKDFIDMHGIFFATGPAFKKGYSTGTLFNIDIYPLLCKIFNIFPRQNIDGRLDRIEFLLK